MKQRNNDFESYCMNTVKHRTYRSLILSLSLFIACTTTALAQEQPNLAKPKIVVPDQIAGVDTVNADQVMEKLSSDDPPLLVDARIKEDREHGFIESSISLPDIETNCDSLNQVSADKKRHLLFYCNGVQCGRSVVAIKIARSCGYHKLSWFKGGFAEWKEKGYQYVKK